MARIFILLILIGGSFAAVASDGLAYKQESDSLTLIPQQKVWLSGFVKSDYWFDSRKVVAAREDLFLLFPMPVNTDANGIDLNAGPIFNFSAITSRLAVNISGPDAFGAEVRGLIEADFSGVTNADINGFRLRHAYAELRWANIDLLMGQWWHPMFTTEVVPSVVSLNTGAPFQAFIRNPQVSLSGRFNKGYVRLSAIAQRDNASDGPIGASPDYIRDAFFPNLHLQAVLKGDDYTVGAGYDYKVIRPRRVLPSGEYTNETLGTRAATLFARYSLPLAEIKAKATYGQNLSEHLMLGGYGEEILGKFSSGPPVRYVPLNHLMCWINITGGRNIRPGIFAGYAKNFGASSAVAGNWYGRGTDIAYMYRLSPSVVFVSGKLHLAMELEYTLAAYGIPDSRGLISQSETAENLRGLLTMLYFF